jgi:lipopolysaccharide cholinephosphotransferase
MGTLPPEISQEGALADLREIKKVFDHFGVRLFLTYGALLGIVRQKNFIPYDDDIDLCIVDPISFETRKRIGNALLDIGYTPQPIAFRVYDRLEAAEPGYNGDEFSGIIVCQKRIRTTLFFFGKEYCPFHGRCMVCHPKLGSGRLIHTPAHFFDTAGTIKFKGDTYLTPTPVNEYLTYMYGNWKVPVKGKHAPQWQEEHPDIANVPRI